MLDKETERKIVDFISTKPRTVQEIAHYIGKNWRTANNYVEKITKETGEIAIRTFREGTRGALKIVYPVTTEKISSTAFQERLFRQILSGRKKEDFSPFDLYQYVSEEKKSAKVIPESKYFSKENFEDFSNFLLNAKSQILFFSGNLSFTTIGGEKNITNTLKELAENGVNIKILTRIELPGIKNILDVTSINDRIRRMAIEIRHCHQPLRTTVVDTEEACLREVKEKGDYKAGELDETTHILYYIYDKEWVEWLQKVFWNLFRTAIPAEKRVEELKKIAKNPL